MNGTTRVYRDLLPTSLRDVRCSCFAIYDCALALKYSSWLNCNYLRARYALYEAIMTRLVFISFLLHSNRYIFHDRVAARSRRSYRRYETHRDLPALVTRE